MADPTLGQLVERTLGQLHAFSTNRPHFATFTSWQGVAPYTGINLGDVGDSLNDALVELDTELVYVKTHDPNGPATSSPAWFRQQQGTPANDSFAANSRVTINPIWPRYHVAQTLVEGIHACYPDLFGVKEKDLTSSHVNGNYELDADCDGILKLTYEHIGPGKRQSKILAWDLDTKNTDGKVYLRTNPSGVPGRKIRVTYRHQPVAPDPATLSTLWSTTGLPSSAQDLPVRYALYTLVSAADLAKFQSHSVPQSDANRFVPTGSTNSVSRRLEEMFRSRLRDESRKLRDLYPPRPHKVPNG